VPDDIAPHGAGGATLERSARRASRVRRVPAVTRAVAILRLLGKAPAPLGVNAIAEALGLVPSTCLHILRVLVAEEFAAFDPATKKYALSAGLLTITRGLLREDSFADLVQHDLDGLSERYGVTAIAVEAIGLAHTVVVAISRPAQAMRLRVDIGSRYPALISATGRCVAAFGQHSWPEIERRFRALRWDRPPEWPAWRREVAAARSLGYAVDDGHYVEGVTIIAAPVPAVPQPTHYLVAVGVMEQLRRLGHAEIGGTLRDAAAILGARLQRG
jgi:DNA-binding IclR family transcriptional regulator